MSTSEDDWRPIESWTPEHGNEVLGYCQYRDQIGRLTEGWNILERDGDWFTDCEGIPAPGLYTHFRPLTRPRDVRP